MDEWIELYNKNSTGFIDVGGWKLKGGKSYTIPKGTIIPPYGFLVFFGSETGIKLNNRGDEIKLFNESGYLIDSYSYTSDPGSDIAIARDPDGYDNWILTSPTPFGPNNETAMLEKMMLKPPPVIESEMFEMFDMPKMVENSTML
jgi:hypothetical protein